MINIVLFFGFFIMIGRIFVEDLYLLLIYVVWFVCLVSMCILWMFIIVNLLNWMKIVFKGYCELVFVIGFGICVYCCGLLMI